MQIQKSCQKGQALVEFGLVGPIFFILIFLLFVSALMMNAQISLDNAIREGARVAALCGNAKGTWTMNDGTIVTSGPNSSPCPMATQITVDRNLGFLRVTSTNPNVVAATPIISSNTSCGGSSYNAPQGCPILISSSYEYQFLLNFIIGPGSPTISLTSSAPSVSQQ
jgi:Flp pilus assembly protein TadG